MNKYLSRLVHPTMLIEFRHNHNHPKEELIMDEKLLENSTAATNSRQNEENPEITAKAAAQSPKSGKLGDESGGGGGQTQPAKSLVDIFYDKINEVIGGDNNNQFFCMNFPATLVDAHSYSYDFKNNESKPPRVQQNESRLANKMFDPCQVTGADNGRSLAQQYLSALDMLTPKLNAKVQEAKNYLRDMLMTPYPYDFGDGMETDLTLQQVFYRLYDRWVELKMEWAKLQADKMDELKKNHPDNTEESNEKIQDEYLTWYQTVAEGYLEGLNEQNGKILAVFSPNDMSIIEGILDSGSGAELEEARETVNNTKKSNPNGGYTYPVTFSPENWFDLLDTSFTGVDLLSSPEAMSEKLYLLTSQRRHLQTQVTQIGNSIVDDNEVENAKGEVKKAQEALDTAGGDLIKSYGDSFKNVLTAAASIADAVGVDEVPKKVLERLVGQNGLDPKTEGLIDGITAALKASCDATDSYTKASQSLADAELAYISAKNLNQLKDILTPIKSQIEQFDEEIEELKSKIALSAAVQKDGDAAQTTAPNRIPNGFTQLTLIANSSSMNTATSKSASSSSSSVGASLFFCGVNHDSSESQSAFKTFTDDEKCEVEIGMSVAKVSIERDWFNPGVFALSGNMCRVSNAKVSPEGDFDGFDQKRFDEMAKCVFPCFPTAFVIAKDVTVKITTSESISSATAKTMEKHASSGGGFLFFKARKSSSSSSSESSASVTTDDKSLTIKFTDPQILGYYLETTAQDKSVYIDDEQRNEIDEYVTILDFARKCKSMLQEHASNITA